jgi:Tfp pilus assembly protein PilE
MKKALKIILLLLFLIIATLASIIKYSDYKETKKKELENTKQEANAAQERAYSLKRYGFKKKQNDTYDYCYNETCTSYSKFIATINSVSWEQFVDPKLIKLELINKNINIPNNLLFAINSFSSIQNFNSLTSDLKKEIRSCNPYSADTKFIIQNGELAFKIRNDFIDKRIQNIENYRLDLRKREKSSDLNLPLNYYIDTKQLKVMSQMWKEEKSNITSLFKEIKNDVNFRKTKYCP